MFVSKRIYLLTSLLLLALLLAACGDKPTDVAEQEGGFMLALPRINVDIDEEGVPSVAGISPETLEKISLGMVDLNEFRMPKNYVDWFTGANVQHMEVVHTSDGLYVFVNGTPMPHLAWDGDSLSSAADLAADLDQLNPYMAKVLKLLIPFIQRTGIDVGLKFPLQPGAEEIPMRSPDAPLKSAASEPESSLAIVRVHVSYDDEGVPSVLAISSKDIEEALGYSLRQVQLEPDFVAKMEDAGIQHITMRTTPNGLLLWKNDDALPYLAWSDENLRNSATLVDDMVALYDLPEWDAVREAVNLMLPMLDNINGEIVLLFPLTEGAESIPIPQP
ncbi:MAG TPA: hypothetical protein G4N94_11680 [Caldilineae bacterium]|nr:hypothetical protein [Caldilineae bacterium]